MTFIKPCRPTRDLVYEGQITHQIKKAFLSLIESKLEKAEESPQVQRRVFHVMVECLQNITKHADQFASDSFFGTEENGRGILLVGKRSEEHYVTTGNIILNNRIEELNKMLEHVNSLTKEELTDLYKAQLSNGRINEKGGAGLGFIDVVRKTGKKLEYEFLPMNKEQSFFVLTIKVPRN